MRFELYDVVEIIDVKNSQDCVKVGDTGRVIKKVDEDETYAVLLNTRGQVNMEYVYGVEGYIGDIQWFVADELKFLESTHKCHNCTHGYYNEDADTTFCTATYDFMNEAMLADMDNEECGDHQPLDV